MLPLCRPALGLALVVTLTGAAGCQAILGIKDVELDTAVGGGGGGTTSSATTTSTSSSSGTGGQPQQADFGFAINAASVNVPYDGTVTLGVEVTRKGGFDDPVVVSVVGAPAGLDFLGTTIAAGQSAGVVAVGATGGLSIGTSFTLEVQGDGGGLSRSDTVPAVVTGQPGTLDTTFGTGGVVTWPWNAKYGGLSEIRLVAGGNILVAGSTQTAVHTSGFAGARLLPGGQLDATFNDKGTPPGTVAGSMCGCNLLFHQCRAVMRNLTTSEVILLGSGPRPDQSDTDLLLMRFDDAGLPSDAGGDKGMRLVDVGKGEYVTAAASDAADRLLALGTAEIGGAPSMFLARFSRKGALDPAFGSAGVVTFGDRLPIGLAVDGPGHVVTSQIIHGTTQSIAVDRVDGAGALTKSFSQDVGSFLLTAAALLPDKGVAVLGSLNGALTLYIVDPTLSGFSAGPVSIATGGDDGPVAVTAFPDGRIVGLGNHAGSGAFLARFLPGGASDATFGGGAGWVDVPMGGAVATSLAVTPDGRILLAGTNGDATTKYGVVAKVWN